MPRGKGTGLRRRTAPALALSLVLLVAGGEVPAASGNAPRPASPWGGVARTSGTPKRTERPAGRSARPAVPVRAQQSGPGDSSEQWALTFSDEFDGGRLDNSKWSNGFGWGQATRSDYGWCDPANNSVSGGVLAQRIDKRPRGGQPLSVGCIHSQNKFAPQNGYCVAPLPAPPWFVAPPGPWG